MKQQTVEFDDMEEVDMPAPAWCEAKRPNRYGSVPGLEDEELADPAELELQVYTEMFAPILALPVRGQRSGLQPSVDESGRIDWGAFGTVDFERTQGEFDKARYKAEKLKARRGDILLMASIVAERVPGQAKFLVLKHVESGVLELDDIVKEDARAWVKLKLQANKLLEQIEELREASRERRQKKTKAWLSGLEAPPEPGA